MSAFDAYPLGKPAFVTHTLDRAAHLRTNDEKLFALEGQSNARAYVVYRDSLVMKQEESGPRALLSIKEALDYGANPGTIFLGLARRRAGVRHGHCAGRQRKNWSAAATSRSRNCAAWRCRAWCRSSNCRRSRWRNRW